MQRLLLILNLLVPLLLVIYFIAKDGPPSGTPGRDCGSGFVRYDC